MCLLAESMQFPIESLQRKNGQIQYRNEVLMIVTVTMNPALDKTAGVDKLVTGGLNRLQNSILDAGGKGINVSKMISSLGGSSTATGFLGGSTGTLIEELLKGFKINPDFVHIHSMTRTNIKICCEDSGITEFNELGAPASQEEYEMLFQKIVSYAVPGVFFVFAGSLPPFAEPDIYRRLILAVKEKGARVFLDAEGEAFRLAVEAAPDVIKPNQFEFMQYFGLPDRPSLQECVVLCQSLIKKGIGTVVLSLGAEGAVFVKDAAAFYAPGLKVKTSSTVGAGDGMAGAFLYGLQEGLEWEEAAKLAIAASAASAATEGTRPPKVGEIRRLYQEVQLIPLSYKESLYDGTNTEYRTNFK